MPSGCQIFPRNRLRRSPERRRPQHPPLKRCHFAYRAALPRLFRRLRLDADASPTPPRHPPDHPSPLLLPDAAALPECRQRSRPPLLPRPPLLHRASLLPARDVMPCRCSSSSHASSSTAGVPNVPEASAPSPALPEASASPLPLALLEPAPPPADTKPR
ncbi:serine/arginine repetitive matrix protein 1-like [Setaria italica]|uniref:serine/arginine repetitive matrix protein 1-like n=1 Tax=Setaria italica TaxID=4555 RepID=UPI000648FE74|nr:serine/arginine repetitive matrix protein 1-like [Setaria italica]